MAFDFIRNRFRNYPVKVVTAEKRGKSFQWSFDKACRITRKDGTQYYMLKSKPKVPLSPPKFEYINVDKKGAPVLLYYSPEDGVFVPMSMEEMKSVVLKSLDVDPIETCPKCGNTFPIPDASKFIPMEITNPPNLKVEDKEMSFWRTLEVTRTHSIYKPKDSLLSVLAPFIMISIIAVALILTTLFLTDAMTTISGNIRAVADSMAKWGSSIINATAPLGGG